MPEVLIVLASAVVAVVASLGTARLCVPRRCPLVIDGGGA